MPTTASGSTRGGGRSALVAVAAALVWLVAPGPAAAPARAEAAATDRELAAFVRAAVELHVVPGYAMLGAAARQLERTISVWCETRQSATPVEVQRAFRGTALALARIEMIRFGPASRDSRLQRIALWPDPRGVVRRQTQRILAEGDRALWNREAIGAQSAAVQGLPALELLLYPAPDAAGSESATEHRCRLAYAIAGNVAGLVGQIATEWTEAEGWRAAMLAPSPAATAPYHTTQEAAAELVRALLTGLQIVREQEIMPWLKAVEASRRSAGLPFERSGLSKDYLLSGIDALRQLKLLLGLDEVAARLAVHEPDKDWMRGWMASAIESLQTSAALFEPPSSGDPEGRPDIKALRQAAFYSNGLRQIIGRELAPAAGLLIGFNELDGD